MAMSREEFEAIYRQWLATNPQVQQRQVAGAGDNESYTPGGTQNYVDFNGGQINLGQAGQGAGGDFQFATPDDYGRSDGTTQYSSANVNYNPNSGFSDLNWKQNYHGNSNIDHLIQNVAMAAGVGGAAYGLSGAGAAAGAGGASGGTGAGMAGAGAAGEAAGAAGIGGSTIGQAMSGAEVMGGGLSGAQAAGGAATAGGIAGSGTGTAGAGGGAMTGGGVAGSGAAALPAINGAMNAGSMSPDGGDSAGLSGQEGMQSAYPATQTTDASILNYMRQIPGMENLTNADLMRAAASLGLGAVSAAGPSNQTTSTQSGNDPATDAYLAQIRARATGLASQPAPVNQNVTTSTSGLSQGLAGLQTAQQTQNGLLGQSNDLVRQGTTPGVSAQNGLLGDVRSMISSANAPRTATANAYAGQNNPYTQQAVDYATGDLSRAYANNVAPRFASGSSFGSSGLGFAEVQARDDLLRRQGQMSNDMRSKDLFAQQQLGESGAARQDNINNLLSQLGISGASVLGNLGSQDAQRADSMTNSNANRYLTGAGQIASNSQIPMNTANNIFNAQNTLWGANNTNTQQATNQFKWDADYPMRQQEMLVNSIGRGGQNTSTTTPNGNAASRFAGGALAGWQAWNNLSQPRGSSSNGRVA